MCVLPHLHEVITSGLFTLQTTLYFTPLFRIIIGIFPFQESLSEIHHHHFPFPSHVIVIIGCFTGEPTSTWFSYLATQYLPKHHPNRRLTEAHNNVSVDVLVSFQSGGRECGAATSNQIIHNLS